tara:strand:+ start:545 stop:733 length:189 start_codon:yes stop_codon:yes gene_type:complete
MYNEEEILDSNLKDLLVVIGSYLYEGAEVEDVDDGTYDRLVTLLVKHINREIGVPPEDETIH